MIPDSKLTNGNHKSVEEGNFYSQREIEDLWAEAWEKGYQSARSEFIMKQNQSVERVYKKSLADNISDLFRRR